ncbi:D-alanyl-D-alanine carboxypeptidase family protein [Virgibacillus salinus]|uniref:D-alanyl-D-alanine carboxypeptidase n=1 Tax=Virgibacillus salinus TaxID=553311 RepID=A0A1H1BMR9_9BACI|nr:D-alanyl-D-alanine carboxypeptidase family protein [Virgibacillus salinus]SDQ53237.1 D-alanyl-D-alanine carboxypeptidase [Virgibacillus salinus]
MRYIVISLCLISVIFLNPTIGRAEPSISANNAVLMEQSSGRVLHEKKAHDKRPIASITKIMTAIIAIESGKLNETVTVSKRAVYTVGSSIYLEQGEKIKLKDLVYGLMLRSGNDAAVAISEYVGGSLEGFTHLMNKKAQWLGMTNTSFDNPHGLDSEDHYSTAYDMALLMRYAMDNEQFRQITGSKSYKPERAYTWQNKNKLLTQLYEYCIGGKTGYTKVAGRTLVTAAEKNDMNLIAVTLDAPDDWQDHIGMYEWGYKNYAMTTIGNQGKVNYNIKESSDHTSGYLHEDITIPLNRHEQKEIESKTFILKNASNRTEDIIGKTIYFINSVPIIETPIYSEKKQDENFFADIVSIYKHIIGFNYVW